MHVDGAEKVTSPVTMWVEALDIGLTKLGHWLSGQTGKQMTAISCSAQQHGTVYWAQGAEQKLKDLKGDPKVPLLDALGGAALWSTRDSPIWADSSTQIECKAIEDALGGAQALADLTGAKAYRRHSGPQIAKIATRQPNVWEKTERVSLVSSFVTSLLTGCYAPIDRSDGSGMNLMDIKEQTWHDQCVVSVAPGLGEKLGGLVDSHTVVGKVAPYMVSRYGFPEDCCIISGSGDNPNALAGLGLSNEEEGIYSISLGTSDTIMAITSSPHPQLEGNVMVNALDPSSYFVMLVYKNGAVCREKMRNEYCNGDWERFSKVLGDSQPGNGGKMGMFLELPEITPEIDVVTTERLNEANKAVPSFEPQEDIRALIEGRFMSMKYRMQRMGLKPPKSILATGGASNSKPIMQVISDIFGAPVFVAESSDAAARGAAYRAKHGYLSSNQGQLVPFQDIIGDFESRGLKKICEPQTGCPDIYDEMLPRLYELEERLKAIDPNNDIAIQAKRTICGKSNEEEAIDRQPFSKKTRTSNT